MVQWEQTHEECTDVSEVRHVHSMPYCTLHTTIYKAVGYRDVVLNRIVMTQNITDNNNTPTHMHSHLHTPQIPHTRVRKQSLPHIHTNTHTNNTHSLTQTHTHTRAPASGHKQEMGHNYPLRMLYIHKRGCCIVHPTDVLNVRIKYICTLTL